ncbi:MAG: glycosyltransferase family 2 protein [Actinomycetes bacterium]
MNLSVIIVLHNSLETIAECVRSIPAEAEVVLVDNESTDGCLDFATSIRPDAVPIRSLNVGFGAGCNIGVRASRGSVVMFLNPDAVLVDDAAEVLSAVVAENPNRVVGPEIRDPSGRVLYVCRKRPRVLPAVAEVVPELRRLFPRATTWDLPPTDPVYEHGGHVSYVQGACLVMSRALFDRVGGFDEEFFLYAEETDLCLRAEAMGGETLYWPQAAIRHYWGHSTSQTSGLEAYELARSTVLLYEKHLPPREARPLGVALLLTAFVRLVLAKIKHSIRIAATRGQGSNASKVRPSWGPTTSGYRDGVARRPSRNSPRARASGRDAQSGSSG